MLRSAFALSAVAAACAIAPPPASAQLDGTPRQVATGLNTPWEVATLPDCRVLVTERPGRIRVLAGDVLQPAPVYTDTTGVLVRKFLGLAVHPQWVQNRRVYLYETYTSGGTTQSRIVRLIDTGSALTFEKVIFDGIGSDQNHDGGRIAFGPDGMLYATTGDIHDPNRPQDLQNFNGKILRMDAEGAPPADNPFFGSGGNARWVWSYGHRHPQGLAWDSAGRLWETEHGPTGEAHAPLGASDGRDELNLIVKGGNYGWPDVAGEQTKAGTIAPVVQSGPPAPNAWAPGDLAFAADGNLYAPALKGEHLRVFVPDGAGGIANHVARFQGTYGRMRVGAADGTALWLTTDGASARLLMLGSRTCVPWTPSVPPPVTAPVPTAPATPRATVTASAAVQTATARLTAALRKAGLRRLLRSGSVAFRVGGLGPGRLSVRLSLIRPGRKALTVAVARSAPKSRATITVRSKLTPTGRRALRSRKTARIRVRVAFAPQGGAKVVRAVTASVRRAPGR